MDVLTKLCREALAQYTVRNSSNSITSGCPINLYPSDLSQVVQQYDSVKDELHQAKIRIDELEEILFDNNIDFEPKEQSK
jgi:hypothetical protein